jgi:DNA polymerase
LSGPEHRAELAALARELRAHAEWQLETGVSGVPKRTPSPTARPAPREAAVTKIPARVEERAPAASAAPGSGSGRLRLATLEAEIRSCQKCPLHATRTQTVFARGNPEAELCFIGEGPGADEDEQGFPFVGKAGQLLDRMIVAMGFSRDDVYVCNIVKCRPPQNRKPEPAEMKACSSYLREQLELVGPKVIVGLGATAVEGLIGMSGGITQIRGQWKLYRGIPLMPTFHPAYLLRTPSAKREVWSDLQAVLKQLGRPVPPAGRSA